MPHNVVIVGCARSGTSTASGTFAHAGYFTHRRGWEDDPYNPKGYFEDLDVLNLNDELLAAKIPAPKQLLGRDHPDTHASPRGHFWLSHAPLDLELEVTDAQLERMRSFVGEPPYCLKDPQFCFSLPAWRPVLGEAKFICVFRHPMQTARSIVNMCATTPHLAPFGVDEAYALGTWKACYEHTLRRHALAGEWLFVHYAQLFELPELERVRAFVGDPKLERFADPKLRKPADETPLEPALASLYDELCARAGHG